MASVQGVFVPYLTDNIFRLSGIGSSSSISELRQAVRRVESGAKVGLRPSVPMSSLLGDSEVESLPQLLQSVSADPVQRTAHRLLWFLHWTNHQPESTPDAASSPQASSNRSNRNGTPASVNALFEDINFPDKVSQVQGDFLRFLLSFLLNKKPQHLEKTLQQYHELCLASDEYFLELIISETKYTPERAQAILREAQQLVAESILNPAVDVALEMLSKQKADAAIRIVNIIVHSPLDDEWEDYALRRISLHTDSLIEKLEKAARDLVECDLDYSDPYEEECKLLLDLAKRLKGRVTQAFRWETAVHNWRDQIGIAKVNRTVAILNAQLESLNRSPHHSEVENLVNLQSVADYLDEAIATLSSIPRHQLSARATGVIDQRLQEMKGLLRNLEVEISKVLQIFTFQLTELKTLVLLLGTGNYALRHEAKIDIQRRAESMFHFLGTLSRLSIGERFKPAVENLKNELEIICRQLGIRIHVQAAASNFPKISSKSESSKRSPSHSNATASTTASQKPAQSTTAAVQVNTSSSSGSSTAISTSQQTPKSSFDSSANQEAQRSSYSTASTRPDKFPEILVWIIALLFLMIMLAVAILGYLNTP